MRGARVPREISRLFEGVGISLLTWTSEFFFNYIRGGSRRILFFKPCDQRTYDMTSQKIPPGIPGAVAVPSPVSGNGADGPVSVRRFPLRAPTCRRAHARERVRLSRKTPGWPPGRFERREFGVLRFSRAVVWLGLLGGPRRYAAPLQRLSRVRYHPPPPSSESETHFRRYFRHGPSLELHPIYDTVEHLWCSRRRSRCALTPDADASCSNTYSPPLQRPLRRSRDV